MNLRRLMKQNPIIKYTTNWYKVGMCGTCGHVRLKRESNAVVIYYIVGQKNGPKSNNDRIHFMSG